MNGRDGGQGMFSNEQMLLLVLFGALLHSWLGAMLRYVWRHRQTAPGFQYWAWSEGLLGMAYLVMLVFFLLPNPAILLASTLLLTLSPLAYEHGLRRFFDDARLLPVWGGYAIASAGLLLQAAAMLWVDDVALRRATVNGSSLLQLLWLWPQVWLARRSRPYAQPLRALLWGLALLAALQGWRNAPIPTACPAWPAATPLSRRCSSCPTASHRSMYCC